MDIVDDLASEHGALDEIVASIDVADWDRPTPSAGWRVRDQIGHLAFFDEQAVLAATDPAAFGATVERVFDDVDAFRIEAERIGREQTGDELLSTWRRARAACVEALRAVDPGMRLPWYGPPMSVRSFATARLMETWAHGADAAAALGREPVASDRLAHIAHLGVSTRGWSYTVRGRSLPDVAVRVELTLPSGAEWTSGDASAAERISGPAVDFCAVVTQRRNVDDTALVVKGEAAEEWMRIAQCFAGGPTDPPASSKR